ncbi:MAG: septal ring lytic transglycosylase RlpA family protein [Candidatus Marinarcus sp.]|uniref:septal ring lytic transglycosylase RlpA family protein n=1 Tax=Candidatus Marinarcus sp. TaxID=3100987 RepID=UPI003AFF64A5
MFLNIKTAVLLISCSLVLLFSGCSNKTYSYSGGYSSSSWKSRKYVNVPKQEIRNSPNMHRATMRPYQVAGKWYYPTLAKVSDVQAGIASWYGPNFHAKKTSNGEIYNMYADTAAHKTLPMNTMVKVQNIENGKTVIVRINDRGPFVSGRIIDLSNKAAHTIDMVKNGTAKVKLTILGFNAKIATTQAEKDEVATVGKYFVQVGAFRRYEGAKITQRKFKLILEDKYDVIIKEGELDGTAINRVWISGFRSEEEARDFKANNGLNSAMIIAE